MLLSACVFFNDTATTEIYTLSLHDALPISRKGAHNPVHLRAPADVSDEELAPLLDGLRVMTIAPEIPGALDLIRRRSEEHTSELQSRQYLVCRLLLEKKNSNSA